jgi:hypothetical protein
MRLLFIFFLAICFFSCHPSGKQERSTNPNVFAPVKEVLADENLYVIDSVQKAFRSSGLTGALQGKKIFLKAIDLYRNQKNSEASLELFRKSIRVWPDPKSYYELGNALMDTKDYKQSLDAYAIASALQFAPVSLCSYNKACAYSMLADTVLATQWLDTALQQGYTDKKQLLNDSDLVNLRNTVSYRILMLDKFKGQFSMEQLQFLSFLNIFPLLQDTFAIRKEDAAAYKLGSELSYDFADFIPGMEDNRFSRSVSSDYQVVGKKSLKNGITLIAYTEIEIMGDTLPPVRTFLQTYDSTGKQIENRLFSCFCDPQTIKSGTLDKDQVLTVTEYAQEWKTDPTVDGYAGNSVIRQTRVKSERFKLNEKGEFIPAEEPLPVSAKK